MNNLKTHFIKNYTNVIKRNLRICFFILNFFVLINRANAQQYVQKSFEYNSISTYATSLLYNPDSSYYILGANYSSPVPGRLLLMKTDSLLNVLWTKSYYKDSVDVISRNIIKASDTTLLLLGGSNSSYDRTAIIIKTDLNGDTLWTQEIKLSGSSIQLDYLGLNADTLILFGNYNVTFIDETSKSLFVRLNINTGQLISANSYNLNSHLTTLFTNAVKQETNNIINYYMLGFGYKDSINFKLDIILIKLNKDFSIEYTKVITSDAGSAYSDLTINSDNNKILCGFSCFDTIFGATNKYCYLELDTLLNVNWAKRYHYINGYTGLSGSKYISKNNTIVCVDHYITYELDSAGNILNFSKTYSNPSFPAAYGSYFESEYHNNKITWVGTINHSGTIPSNKLLITMTDEHGNGCQNQNVSSLIPETVSPIPYDDSSMTITQITLENSSGIKDSNVILNSNVICTATTSINSNTDNFKEVILYPNPFSNEISISGLRSEIDYSLKVYNIIGEQVYQSSIMKMENNTVVNLSFLNAGMYLFCIKGLNHESKYFKVTKLQE